MTGRVQGKGVLASVGAVVSAVVASACCIGPVLLAALGVGGAGFGAALTPYRPYFLAATALLLGGAFFQAYRPVRGARCEPGEACAAPTSRRRLRGAVWLATLLAVGAGAYPYLVGAGETGPAVAGVGQTVELAVTGMTCAACATHVRIELEQVPGVASATVLYPEGTATVELSTDGVLDEQLIAAVRRAGYEASVRARPSSQNSETGS